MADSSSPQEPSRCINLCCKSMLVFGEAFESDPEYQSGVVNFWCNSTAKGQGPDGEVVALDPCSNPERTCHRAY
jgi:hypothetical protein